MQACMLSAWTVFRLRLEGADETRKNKTSSSQVRAPPGVNVCRFAGVSAARPPAGVTQPSLHCNQWGQIPAGVNQYCSVRDKHTKFPAGVTSHHVAEASSDRWIHRSWNFPSPALLRFYHGREERDTLANTFFLIFISPSRFPLQTKAAQALSIISHGIFLHFVVTPHPVWVTSEIWIQGPDKNSLW